MRLRRYAQLLEKQELGEDGEDSAVDPDYVADLLLRLVALSTGGQSGSGPGAAPGAAPGGAGGAEEEEDETDLDERVAPLKVLWDLSVNPRLCELLEGLDCPSVVEVAFPANDASSFPFPAQLPHPPPRSSGLS